MIYVTTYSIVVRRITLTPMTLKSFDSKQFFYLVVGVSSPGPFKPNSHLNRNATKGLANGKHGPGHCAGSFQVNYVYFISFYPYSFFLSFFLSSFFLLSSYENNIRRGIMGSKVIRNTPYILYRGIKYVLCGSDLVIIIRALKVRGKTRIWSTDWISIRYRAARLPRVPLWWHFPLQSGKYSDYRVLVIIQYTYMIYDI